MEIIRNRKIRPSTRLKTSVSYKIDTEKLKQDDKLIVNISHENINFKKTYIFSGKDIYPRKSIHFIVNENEKNISIKWTDATPIK